MKKALVMLFILTLFAAMCPANVPPPPAITHPNGGESLILKQQVMISWTCFGFPATVTVYDLILYKGGKDQAHKLGYITQNHYPLCASGACSFQWEVGAYEGGSAGPGNDYYIEIVLTYNGDYSDFSDNPFSIVSPKIPIERLHGFVEFNPDPGCPMCGIFEIGALLAQLGNPSGVAGNLVILRNGRQVGLLGRLGRGGLLPTARVRLKFPADDFALLGQANQGFEAAIIGDSGNILKRAPISLRMRR